MTILLGPGISWLHLPGLEISRLMRFDGVPGSEDAFIAWAIIVNIGFFVAAGFVADLQRKIKPWICCAAEIAVLPAVFQVLAVGHPDKTKLSIPLWP